MVEKENGPKTINDVKLINAGKILENNRTIAESRLPVGGLPGGVITMHVVVRAPLPDKNSGNSFNHMALNFHKTLSDIFVYVKSLHDAIALICVWVKLDFAAEYGGSFMDHD